MLNELTGPAFEGRVDIAFIDMLYHDPGEEELRKLLTFIKQRHLTRVGIPGRLLFRFNMDQYAKLEKVVGDFGWAISGPRTVVGSPASYTPRGTYKLAGWIHDGQYVAVVHPDEQPFWKQPPPGTV